MSATLRVDLKNKKGVAIIYTPRCGSTPIARLLAAELEQTHATKYLEDAFNSRFTGLAYSRGKINVDLSNWQRLEKVSAVELAEAVDQKINWLGKSKEKFVLKFNPAQVNSKQQKWLIGKFQIVFCERRDRFDQLLSFLISWQTGAWYKKGRINVKKRSIVARYESFIMFARLIFEYELIKKRFSKPVIYYYEDFEAYGHNYVLTRSRSLYALKKRGQVRKAALTEKQNVKKKIDFFVNANELRSWFDNSFLSR